MTGYSWVAVISIFCYMFLLISVFPQRKKTPVIGTFIELLVIMILWNGGSLFMRLQLFGTVNLWHHMSLLGMTFLAVGYYHFVTDFLEKRSTLAGKVWLIFYLVLFGFNCITNLFIPLPEVVTANGSTQFLYHYTWHTYLYFIPVFITVAQLSFIIWRHCRGNHIAFQQLLPIALGILSLLLGHALTVLPMFIGFPIDMLSGVVNTIFLFYALYKKKLFSMSILLSKYNIGFVSLALGIVLFSDLAVHLQYVLTVRFGMDSTLVMILVCAFLVLLIVASYFIIKYVSAAIFTRSEQKQKNAIARFSEEVTYMLNMDDILQILADTVQESIDVERLFVLIRKPDGNFHIEHTINPLEEKNFFFRSDHPLLSYFKTHNEVVRTQDFSRLTIYRSMWEKEKSLLNNLHIDSFIPLMCDSDLIGFVMFASKQGKIDNRPNTLQFLQSVADICAVAVKNAYTYEKALDDAQKDNLTGLINLKYFLERLDMEFDKNHESLSLCLMDIDDFRMYNQLYGTHEGDIALRRIADVLRSAVGENGFAARIDGDEFALILPGYDIYSAKCLMETIVAQTKEIGPSFNKDSSNCVTMSIGICAAPYMASTSKELYRNADSTVYTAKRNGKNAIVMYSAELNRRDSGRTSYKSAYNEHAGTINALTAAIDTKDHCTSRHSENVAYYSAELAKAAGIAPDLVEIVRESGLLHDIGKIGIPEEILNKPDKLSPAEYEIIKSHVDNAVGIIRHLPSLDYVIPAVYSHHERYDGKGYPRGLAGDNIPITGRILSIADAFDAITSVRKYKDACSPEEAVKRLRAESGKHFDPHLVETFIELVESGKLEIRGSGPTVVASTLPFGITE